MEELIKEGWTADDLNTMDVLELEVKESNFLVYLPASGDVYISDGFASMVKLGTFPDPEKVKALGELLKD